MHDVDVFNVSVATLLRRALPTRSLPGFWRYMLVFLLGATGVMRTPSCLAEEARVLWERRPAVSEGVDVWNGIIDVGDLNGDGIQDFVIPFSIDNPSRPEQPTSWRIDAVSGASFQKIWTFDEVSPVTTRPMQVARAVGDVDCDGVADVAVRTSLAPGADGSIDDVAQFISGRTGLLIASLTPRQFGFGRISAVAGAGRVDDDACSDVALSDSYTKKGRGVVKLYSLSRKRTLRTIVGRTAVPPLFIAEKLGEILLSVADQNNDGEPELVITAPDRSLTRTQQGAVYIYSPRTGKVLRAMTGRTPGQHFGAGIQLVADMDGDGTRDLSFARAWDMWRSGRTLRPLRQIKRAVKSLALGDTIRSTPLGDLNGDGALDLLGAPRRRSRFCNHRPGAGF